MSLRLRIMLTAVTIVVISAVTVGVIADVNSRATPTPGPLPTASPTVVASQVPPPPEGRAYRDFAFDPAAVSAPTSSRTQSKAWFAFGTWWAAMYAPGSHQSRIFRLDPVTQVWADTGTLIDERPTADADMLWTGERLYAVTGGTRPSPSHAIRVVRFSYDEAGERFVRDADFPVTIADAGAPATSIAIDSAGTVWVAYGYEGRIHLTHTDGNDAVWVEPLTLEAPEAVVDAVDVASIVAYGPGRLGILWTNQLRGSVYFSSREDGAAADAWSEPQVVVDRLGTDDHLSAKAFPLADGTGTSIVLAMKTALDDQQGVKALDPLILLAVLDGGEWRTHLAAQVRDRLARPLVLVDGASRSFLVAASSSGSGGAIRYKRASIDDVIFDTGPGTALITSPVDQRINDPTSTRQVLDAESGLLVLAADTDTGRYAHGLVDLGGGLPPADPDDPDRPSAPIPAPADATTTLLHDTFESWPTGPAARTGWSLVGDAPVGKLEIVDDGDGGQALRLGSAAGAAGARACRDFPEVEGVPLRIEVRVRTSAIGLADTSLASVRGAGGEAASARVTDKGVLAWFAGVAKTRSPVPVARATWYRIRFSLDQAADTYGIRFMSDGSRGIIARSDLAWRMAAVDAVNSVCIETPGAGPAQTIDLGEVSVLQTAQP